MESLEEIADVLNGTLQEETQYRGQYKTQDGLVVFDVSGLITKEYTTELIVGLNESDDGKVFTFAFISDEEGREFIHVTKK